jgi:hypothetical protein
LDLSVNLGDFRVRAFASWSTAARIERSNLEALQVAEIYRNKTGYITFNVVNVMAARPFPMREKNNIPYFAP